MWKVEVTQEYEADGGYACRDIAVLAVEDLKSAEDVVSVFEKYGVGVIEYSIIRIRQNNINEESGSKVHVLH